MNALLLFAIPASVLRGNAYSFRPSFDCVTGDHVPKTVSLVQPKYLPDIDPWREEARRVDPRSSLVKAKAQS